MLSVLAYLYSNTLREVACICDAYRTGFPRFPVESASCVLSRSDMLFAEEVAPTLSPQCCGNYLNHSGVVLHMVACMRSPFSHNN